MAKYIDLDAFLEHERAWYCKNCIRRTDSKGKIVYEIGEAPCRACDIEDVLDDLDDYPAADVVERKTGKWIYDSEPYPLGNPYGHYGCDQCGESVPARTNFCPNCGAQMIGGDENAL